MIVEWYLRCLVQAEELDQNKDGRILKSDLADYALKLKQDESFSSRTESSYSLASDLLDTSSQSYSNCKDLVRFSFEWEKSVAGIRCCVMLSVTVRVHRSMLCLPLASSCCRKVAKRTCQLSNRYCRNRDAALERTLRSCTVEDFEIEEELGRGSAGQLWRVCLRQNADGSTAEASGRSGEEMSPFSKDNASVALKKIWDLNGSAGPSATEFEAAQRKDYTVPLRYPHPCV